MVVAEKLSLLRQVGFAIGDFGLNLYWQSITFFLVFFYTDIAGLSASTAGFIFMGATIFEACVDPIIGALMDRKRGRFGRYGTWIIFGSVPLGASFVLLFWTPKAPYALLIAILALTHLFFRLCYTSVAVPFSALTARMTDVSIERTTLTGLRMLFATAAGSVVAFCMQPLVSMLGDADARLGFIRAAICIAALATTIFLIVILSVRERDGSRGEAATSLKSYIQVILSNRAFVTLVIGLLFASASSTTIGRSVIYYFKYVVRDESAARYALSLSSAAAFVAVPVWVVVARRIGKREMWIVAAAMGIIGLVIFAAFRPATTNGATAFFVWMQASNIGIAVAYWSMLPDTVEYGLSRSGIRQESLLFGMFSLFQKVGLALAAGAFGWAFDAIGYVANVVQTGGTTHAMGTVIISLCAFGLLGSGIGVFFSPLRKGIHEQIVERLRRAERPPS